MDDDQELRLKVKKMSTGKLHALHSALAEILSEPPSPATFFDEEPYDAAQERGEVEDVPQASDIHESPGLPLPTRAKEKKTAEELAAMIHRDLSQVEGCPKHGVEVTVYGLNPWNALIMFGADAGPVPNKADLRGFCDIITERLKRLYDV
jgi:hypothetical protein